MSTEIALPEVAQYKTIQGDIARAEALIASD